MRRFSLITLGAFLLSAVPALGIPTNNTGTIVNLRIEGKDSTIYEGPIFTRGHYVETALGGSHRCDGTNLGANPNPGPTVTSALDDASKLKRFVWDGKFYPQYEDYLVSNIAGVLQTESTYWGIYVNYRLAEVGGCQQQVKLDDEVLWAYGTFEQPPLKLSGPNVARVGRPITLTVTNGVTGAPVAGALVDGETSDAVGKVSLTFSNGGVKAVKAKKANSIRSNGLVIVVAP
ncbi:hypothetical protein H0H81_006815 [Sphagnurus paluster]|uniref:Transcobalamin-like C-terminal domain-containing protein n=1 Tax=Sphagnurus paluster TaxID=117069 RepID=A0A9P7K552_9AGAR|nr:hypothetical protein H0H81_006815 [Sphagnurus paluster]